MPNDEWPLEWSTQLTEEIQSNEEILRHIKEQFQRGYYDTLMVDEVQDFPRLQDLCFLLWP